MKSLFATAFIQVFLISVNVVFLTERVYVGIVVVGFLISWFWTANVKKISTSTRLQRVAYCTGAACGNIAGMLLSSYLVNLFQ